MILNDPVEEVAPLADSEGSQAGVEDSQDSQGPQAGAEDSIPTAMKVRPMLKIPKMMLLYPFLPSGQELAGRNLP